MPICRPYFSPASVMPKENFKDYICRKFCVFFRDDTKEDMACQGALIVENLLIRGLVDQAFIMELGIDTNYQGKHDNDLDDMVCRYCSFKAEDCDFQSAEKIPDAEPCGGYRLLRILKTSGYVTVADLEADFR